ncbi:MAG: tRNA pseudouridine(55) synthase TruB [Spirochaetaceae bacterium]|nr:tRNA pseudouridine(55) synthase TruB [Spirochaetaceae bacterium]
MFDALLLLNKSSGITSFEALNPVKKALGTGKAGHSGSLDKFADGLLVVLAGKALKLTPYVTGCSKRYEALVRLGIETDTLDPEGRVIAEAPVPAEAALTAAMERFRGGIMQTPPAFSAIHVGGKRAHELVRSGIPVEMKPRPVTIHELVLRDYDPPFARVGICCSAGTYIRALARDIALEAGSRAHLAGLTRTMSGAFSLTDALSLPPPPIDPDVIKNALHPIDRSIFDALSIPVVEVDEKTAAAMRYGKPVAEVFATHERPAPLAVFCGDSFIALLDSRPAENNAARWRYAFVF